MKSALSASLENAPLQPAAGPRRASSGRKPRVLSFCRPYLTADFHSNFAPLAGEFDFEFLTDGRSPGTPDTRARFYAALRSGRRCDELDEATQADVMMRCRLLRNLPEQTARRLLHAMAHVLGGVLDRWQPQVIMCHQVDEYVTHLLSLLGARRGILFVGYARSYFPGLIQVMRQAHGEGLPLREPGDAEVDNVLNVIAQPLFRQDYSQRANYSLARHIKGLARYRVKQVVFGAKALLEQDPWNLHYAITPYVVERRRLRDFPRPGDFAADWVAQLGRLSAADGRRVVYIPLAYFPESTIDYWVRDTRILRYEEMTLAMARALAQRYIVVVKEHRHMMGGRDTTFYRRLRDEPGVVSVHPMEHSNQVLAAADAVIVGAGSVGVEAAIRGKPVLSYCDTSYWYAASGASLLSLGELDGWPRRVEDALRAYRQPSERETREFVRACMRSTVRSRDGGRIWPLVDIADLRTLLQTADAAAHTLTA